MFACVWWGGVGGWGIRGSGRCMHVRGECTMEQSYPHLTMVCVSFAPGGLCTSIQDLFPWRLSTSHPTLTARTTIEGQPSCRTWRCSTSTILLRTGQILVSEGVEGNRRGDREKKMEGFVESSRLQRFHCMGNSLHMHPHSHRTRCPSSSPGAGG